VENSNNINTKHQHYVLEAGLIAASAELGGRGFAIYGELPPAN
jgi:hypothetical protein